MIFVFNFAPKDDVMISRAELGHHVSTQTPGLNHQGCSALNLGLSAAFHDIKVENIIWYSVVVVAAVIKRFNLDKRFKVFSVSARDRLALLAVNGCHGGEVPLKKVENNLKTWRT